MNEAFLFSFQWQWLLVGVKKITHLTASLERLLMSVCFWLGGGGWTWGCKCCVHSGRHWPPSRSNTQSHSLLRTFTRTQKTPTRLSVGFSDLVNPPYRNVCCFMHVKRNMQRVAKSCTESLMHVSLAYVIMPVISAFFLHIRRCDKTQYMWNIFIAGYLSALSGCKCTISVSVEKQG